MSSSLGALTGIPLSVLLCAANDYVRNATLGLGDANDRAYPDRVSMPFPEKLDSTKKLSLLEKFRPPPVRGVKMSRLHTAVITAYPDSRVLLCGFGSGGR
jgi:inhibitor of Bruton tyrosine kinase